MLAKGLQTIGLLVLSNTFMTLAWYGHLRFTGGHGSHKPLIVIVLISWGIALLEYLFQIPANRIGFVGNGGPFSLVELKVIQEVLSLLVFVVVCTPLFGHLKLGWNHVAAMVCLVGAVYFVFRS